MTSWIETISNDGVGHINPNLVCSQSKYEFHFNDICVEQGLSTNHHQIEPTV